MKKISKIEPKLPVVLDVNVSTCFDCQDDLVYVLLFALNLHNHRSVPFILHPACAGEHLGSMASPVSESDSLDGASKNNVSADHGALLWSWKI